METTASIETPWLCGRESRNFIQLNLCTVAGTNPAVVAVFARALTTFSQFVYTQARATPSTRVVVALRYELRYVTRTRCVCRTVLITSRLHTQTVVIHNSSVGPGCPTRHRSAACLSTCTCVQLVYSMHVSTSTMLYIPILRPISANHRQISTQSEHGFKFNLALKSGNPSKCPAAEHRGAPAPRPKPRHRLRLKEPSPP